MANKNKAKGSLAERGVRDYINLRFPLADQGIGASIIPSKGSLDIGDIDGVPFTMIEVKNYKEPVWGKLVGNAEWKYANSGRDFWSLVSKRHRFSALRAGKWDAVTTVSGLKNFGLVDSGGGSVADFISSKHGGEQRVFTFDNFIHDHLNIVVNRNVVIYPFSCYSGIGNVAHKVIDSHEMCDDVVLCVFPRRSKEVDDYYEFTNLEGYTKMLEAVGIVPQLPANA